MSYLERVLGVQQMSRRNFVFAGAAAAAGLAGASLAGCGPTVSEVVDHSSDAGDYRGDITSGEWKTAACWHNCGGRCLNKVLVQDGVVIRQKTDDTHEDSKDFPQQRACVRGRAQRNHVFSADRLRYPMKRKNWKPGGGENSRGELRGMDEWERISWDEAFGYIADEINRILATYGSRAFYGDGGAICRVLSTLGGFIPHWGTTSRGAWTYTPDVVGIAPQPNEGINDRLDMRNSELVIMLGVNPAWSSAGNPAYFLNAVKEAGAKFIAIDPFYNDSYAMVDAEWIPCRPSTDLALLLGIAYAMLEMDAEKKLIDWDYLNTHTVGFDAEHMPEGEDPKNNFKDHLLGTYDGTPKTPEWASKRCGTTPENIRYLAEQLGKDKKVAFMMSWASARTHNADTLPQAVMTIGAMGGHYGKSGHMCGLSCHSRSMSGGTYFIGAGGSGLAGVRNPLSATEGMNHTEMWQGILNGKYIYSGTGTSKVPGEIRDVDIKMIVHDSTGAKLQTTDGQADGIAAHRKVECVVTHSLFYTTNARYSDIVLPIISRWEAEGGFLQGNREAIIFYQNIVPPMYECKSDENIGRGLAEKMGIDPLTIYSIDEHQQLFNQIAGAYYLEETDGKERKKLVTITQQDIDEWKCTGEPQQGLLTIAELKERGAYQIPRSAGDKYGYIAYEAFVKDPVANPMKTTTGLQEICSPKLRDSINAIGFSKIEAIPTYIPPEEGYEATFKDRDIDAAKGEYPFQVYNPHYLRRSHTIFDNVQWLRETWPNPVFIAAQDAKSLGIATGDTVILESPHGKVLRHASVTERMIPGVIGLPHGAWVDVDEKTGIDRAGSDNYLTGQIQSGQGVSGWNTAVCSLKKYTESIPADIELGMRIPEAQK